MEAENTDSMEKQALKRRERLKNLKRKVQAPKDDEAPRPRFRSYKPLDKNLTSETDNINKLEVNVEDQIKSQLELLKTPITIEEIDISNLAPRKQDWDLKRDISKKLEKLDWLTQKSIAELIRDRLKKNQENVLQVVSIATDIQSNDK